jgi:hypothetical protein
VREYNRYNSSCPHKIQAGYSFRFDKIVLNKDKAISHKPACTSAMGNALSAYI